MTKAGHVQCVRISALWATADEICKTTQMLRSFYWQRSSWMFCEYKQIEKNSPWTGKSGSASPKVTRSAAWRCIWKLSWDMPWFWTVTAMMLQMLKRQVRHNLPVLGMASCCRWSVTSCRKVEGDCEAPGRYLATHCIIGRAKASIWIGTQPSL